MHHTWAQDCVLRNETLVLDAQKLVRRLDGLQTEGSSLQRCSPVQFVAVAVVLCAMSLHH